MRRAAIFSLVLTANAAAAQVPTTDLMGIAQRLEAYLKQEADAQTQTEKAQIRADLKDAARAQDAALDRLIDAFGAQRDLSASYVSGTTVTLDGEVLAAPGIEDTYGPTVNAAAGYIFGDAREDIEAVIIRGAADTYPLAGVQRAGLTRVQWRCLMQALIKQESRFQVGARSPAAAFGLTQIIPGTAQYLGIYPEFYENPYLQVTGGARYLAEQLERFDGNIIHALAAYNAGPGAVMAYGGVPPFKETQGYVVKIPRYYNEYLARVGGPEALGTIDPALYAAAEASLLSIGSAHYAGYSHKTALTALLRVRALLAALRDTDSVAEAYDLNTLMRAELIFITAARTRLKAAQNRALSADEQAHLARQRQAEAFLVDWSLTAMPEL